MNMTHLFRKNIFILLFMLTGSLAKAGTFYWVGGSGQWNDAAHWSMVSNGTGGAGVPATHDDVIFDNASFNSSGNIVFIPGNIAFRSFLFSHSVYNPQLVSSQPVTVAVSGGWEVTGNFRNYIQGRIQFNNSSDVNLNPGIVHFRCDVYKSGAGILHLMQPLVLEPGNEIVLSEGTFMSNGYDVVADRITFQGTLPKTINLNASTLALIDPVNYNTTNLTSYHIGTTEILLDPPANAGTYTTRGTSTCGIAPNQFTITVSVTTNYNGENISCNGACDATVCVAISGWPGPYGIQWLGSGGPTTNCWTGRCPGTYTVRVYDSTHAVFCAASVAVTEPGPVTVLAWQQTNPSCNGVCDGSAQPQLVFGGVGPYTYSWGTGETTPIATQLCVGLNSLHIEDANACPFDTSFFILTPTPLFANVTTTSTSCFGSCDGIAVSNPSGGNGAPYTFSWSSGAVTNTASNLCAGSYTLHFEDNNGCPKDTSITITQPAALAITLTNQTNLLCNAVCSGSLTVSSSNGTQPHSYQWYSSPSNTPLIGQTSPTASGLCAGDYYVIVTDAGGCTQQSPVYTITQPAPIGFTTTPTPATCHDACDGTLSGSANGGVGPYSFNWILAATGSSVGTGTPLTGVCPDTYFAEITDANGCIVNSIPPITVNNPPALSLDIDSTGAICNMDCNGTATVNAAGGGTGALTFAWFDSAPTQIGTGNNISGLCAGSYSATVTDANGCQLNVPFTIPEPANFDYVLTTQDVSCIGTCDGTATLSNITGQTSPYTISWSTSANTGLTENNLCTGNFSVTITDANGCDTIIPFSIGNPTPLILAPGFNDPTCSGICNGQAWANPSGGTGAYTYVWTDLGSGFPLGQATDTVTSLCPGNYQVVVTDGNGCTATTTFTITNPGGMSGTVSTTNSSCGICDGSASVVVSGGTPNFSFVWMDATTGNPVGNTSNPANNLCAGNYYVIITDANGCSVNSDTAALTDNVVITATATGTDPACFGYCNGSIDLTVSGGTPPFTYQWFDQSTNNPIGQSTEDAVGLCQGTYYVIVTDSAGCTPGPVTVTITEPTQLTGSANGNDATCFGVCNGQGALNANGGTTPYSFSWIDNSNGSTVSTNQNVNTLCAGSYDATVTDANGCSVGPFTVTINEPAAMILSVNPNDANCFNVCDGSAVASVSGGSSPYSFTWSSSGNTTANEINLCDGNYTVSATDANGCPVGPVNFTINEPTQFTATTVDGSVLCSGSCNGSVSVNPSGGTMPYSYQWDAAAGNQTAAAAINLCAGTFNVTVTDANGCNVGPLSAQITEPASLSGTTSSTNTSCNGNCDGTATVSANGGTAPYTYLWNDPLSQNTTTAISLCAGSYDVTVTDANGCTFSPGAVTVTAPPVLSVSASSTDVNCFAACDGTGTVNIAGGTAPFNISWNDPANQSTATATSLCAGNYIVSVTDANGCSGNDNISVTEPAELLVSSSATQSTCSVCDGTATVIPSGGTGSLSVLWNDPSSQTTTTASALCAGIYNATITDGNGCSLVVPVAVSDQNGETLTTDSTNASCFGVCDGSVTVSFTCSDPTCTILWNDPSSSNTNTVTNLCAGTYGVTVTNNSGCISTATVTVSEPNELSANMTSTNVLCNGACNGTGTTTPSGGTAPYTYQWGASAANQTTSTAFNLCPGSYSVIVTDAVGCSVSGNVNITEPSALAANTSFADLSCNNACDGTGTAFPAGGVAPYSYLWDDPAAQSTQQATGLCAGNYNVTVFDANGCTFGPLSVNLSEPAPINFTMSNTALNCFGDCDGTATANVSGGTSPYSYQWDAGAGNQTTATASNLCAGNYSVVITDVNGCPGGTGNILLNSPDSLSSNFTISATNCNASCDGSVISVISGGTLPYSLQWNNPSNSATPNIFNLCPGSYDLDITDANGCNATFTATITNPTAITANVTAGNVTCNGACNGTINTNPTGGTAPYTYLWNTGATTQNIGGLCPGVYSVTITDANGCTKTVTRNITEPSPITYTTGFFPSSCGVCNGTVSVSPSGGVPGYTYQWGANAGNQTTQSALSLCAGVYNVVVTDANGCTVSTSVGLNDIGAETVTVTATDASCYGVCDGTATAATACVNGPCNFSWFATPSGTAIGQNTALANSLCAGGYLVQVTNGVGCISVQPATINEPSQVIGNAVVTDLLCNGVCNGSIALTPSGGTGPYTYQWGANAGNATSSAVNNLCAGTYLVDITDAVNCTQTDTIVVVQPNLLSANASSIDVACNGDCNGSASASINGGVTPYTIQWNDPGGQTTSAAVGLCAGNYTVNITDANGCNVTGNVTINQPVVLSATVASTDALCNGDCSGTATVTPSGGTMPYNYQWNDPALQTGITANALCPGNYSVIVGDSSNCSAGPLNITINNPAVVSFTVSSTDNTCGGFCSGTITISASGGAGGYLYSIDNGTTFQASNVFNNLCSGAYNVVVQDANSCASTPQNVNINEPSVITATTSQFQASCNQSDGAASVFPSGGTPGYTYAWMDASLNPIGQTTQTAINLSAGIYVVSVTDAAGCSDQFTVTVTNVNAPAITGVTTNITCNGSCDGMIDVTTSGGTAPYSYIWIPDGQTTEDISNLCAGGYTIKVTDAAGCINIQNFNITQPTGLSASFAVTDANCGQCNGLATVAGSGGTTPYTFAWSNGQSVANATNLCAGAYMVQITDASGCVQTFNTAINNIGGPTGETITQNNVSCAGLCDGDVTVSPVGGTAPYTYYWIHDGSTTNSLNGLCAGNYFLEVTDTNGCVRMSDIHITEPTPMSDSTVMTPATCGLCDGVLSVFPAGGAGGYTYLWDAGAGSAATSIVSALCEAVYTVIITDANGCKDTVVNVVNGADAPQLSTTNTNVTCQGNCDGTSAVTINLGTAPYNTTWLDDSGSPIGQIGTNASNLCAGDYIVQVSDAAGCSAFGQFSITEPDSLLFSLPFIQAPSCFNTCDGIATTIVIEGTLPYTFSWNDPSSQTTAQASNLCAGNFVVTVTDGNGCATTQSVTVPSPTPITVQLDSTDASCSTVADGAVDATPAGGAGGFVFSWTGPNGFTASTEDISNIFPGTYVLTITDANGCSLTDSIVVGAILVVDASAGNDTTLCAGSTGGIILSGSGGVTYEWYDLSGNLLSSSATVNVNPQTGTESYILIANNSGCIDQDTIDVTVNPLPNVSAGPDVDMVIHTSAVIGGTPTTNNGNTVVWSPDYHLTDTTSFNPTATPDSTTTYVVTVTDPNGCQNSDTMVVYVYPDITFPNGFSPNGDGKNDTWVIDMIVLFPDAQVEIYNRWGELLFLSVGYHTPWDGTYNSKPVAVGTYYYIINLNNPLYPDAFTGPLTVIR